MKKFNVLILAILLATPLFAEDTNLSDQHKTSPIAKSGDCTSLQKQGYYDSSKRSRSPYQNYDSYSYSNHSFGDSSRYSTSQGWSRGRDSYWWGRRNDMPTSGYSSSTLRK